MKQAYKNGCMGLIPKVDPTPMVTAPHYSTLSYIITIPISHSKLRIKIPKLLLKTMQRRVHKDVYPDPDRDQTRNKKKRTENFLLRKAGRILTNIKVFGNKKSPQNTPFKNGNNDVVKDVHGVRHAGNGIETGICEDDHDHDNQPFEVEQEFSPPEFHSAKKTSEGTDDDEGSKEMRSKLSPKRSLPLAYLFNEEKSMNFNIKSKTSSRGFISNKDNDNGGGGVANSLKVIGESSPHLIRVPSRISTIRSRRKLRIAVFVRKIESKKFEEHSAAAAVAREESGGGLELCKKRILMGSKCKPLNLSGTLQYDNDGILLPETLGN